jgi:hypothetical protein
LLYLYDSPNTIRIHGKHDAGPRTRSAGLLVIQKADRRVSMLGQGVAEVN